MIFFMSFCDFYRHDSQEATNPSVNLLSQVIVFYHHPWAEKRPFLWPGSKIPAPWANTTDAYKLIQFLETTLGERAEYGSFHVSQAILTPRVKTIIWGLIQGLRDHLVERCFISVE